MIKETEEENVKLSEEENFKLTEAQRRLHVIQNEISLANKNLQLTSRDSEKAYKEKLYQEELLKNIQDQVEALKREKEEISIRLDADVATLNELLKKIKEGESVYNIKNKQLNEREEKLNKDEEAHKKNVQDFNNKSSQFLEDQLAIKTAKEAFLKATETVTW